MEGYVHNEDPFKPNEEDREPARRFRGRLVSPVTIWTAGTTENPTGLTVGSLIVAEGERSHVIGLLNDLTDLYERISETHRFVVHVLAREQRVLAETFAGTRPSPGGLFSQRDVGSSGWGPVLLDVVERAYCELVDIADAGYQRLVRAAIVKTDLGQLDAPLVHFRGRYRSLDP